MAALHFSLVAQSPDFSAADSRARIPWGSEEARSQFKVARRETCVAEVAEHLTLRWRNHWRRSTALAVA